MILVLLSFLSGLANTANAQLMPLPGPVTDVKPALENKTEENKNESEEEERTTVRHGIITAITVPQPLALGYEVIYPSIPELHFFAEGGYFVMPLSGHLKNASVWSIQAGARFFPFDNWFYLAGSLGFRQVGLGTDISNLQVNGVSLANTADLRLNAAILGLAVGGQWFLSPKVAFSFDLGVQLAIPLLHGGNTSIVQDTPDGTDLSVDDADALYRITSIPLPQIALVRFIWYID